MKMVFTKEDKVAIKFLRENKRYGAKRFLAEFPSKQWSLSGLKYLLKKIDETGSIERSKGAGRPRSVRCDDNIECVEHLALSQEDKPGTHLTQREIARETGISQRTVGRILKNDLHLRCFKKHRATELTEANKIARLHRARQLLNKYPASLVNFIVFTDEKVFTVARPTNSQNDRVYAPLWHRKETSCHRSAVAYAPYLQPFINGIRWGVGSRNNQHPFRRAWSQSKRSVLPRSPSDAKTSA